ncbi:MAG: SIMPL domain-containing protein [Erythrobacter sp.]|nr:SIMPL domain-containing protein [Erythrobacter sp.]
MMPRRYAAALALALAPSAPVHAQSEMARPVVLPGETILRVVGEGKVQAPPTQMTIEIGVESLGATAAEALDANNRQLEPVIEALRERGIAASQFQTSDLSVEPQYSNDRGRQSERITGFMATNTLSVTTNDLDQAGALVSVLFDAGANRIDGPRFSVAPQDEGLLTRAAQAQALENAREEAENVAETLGLAISRILLVSDSSVVFRGGARGITVTGSRISRTPIEPGEVSITARYNVEFALRAR